MNQELDHREIAAVIAREEQRQRAAIENDLEQYAELLADDFSIVHTNGHRNNKVGLLAMLGGEIEVLAIRWENLSVRLLGDVALLQGDMFNTIRGRARQDIQINPHRVLELWQKDHGAWRMIVMHCTQFGHGPQPVHTEGTQTR